VLRILRDTWRKNGPELIAAVTGGLPEFVMSGSPSELQGIPVFCYHQVDSTLFESHLRFLRDNGYRALTADEFLSALRPADSSELTSGSNARVVVITFDDGLLNLHETVFPLLREYGTPVVAFIAPAFHATWTSQRASHASDGVPTCSWEQIEAMHASGLVDFQSHTLEHRLVYDWPRGAPLSGMSDSSCDRLRGPALALADDFARARAVLERRLGKRVRHLAFPQYEGTRDAVRIGRACGYDAFYWGVRPWQPINARGDDLSRIVRLSGEFLPRLPGRGRIGLRRILRERYRPAPMVARHFGRVR
jgi:peptidoglycan/xylan/chitin deacetylase (PgdA/CDA1 family)